MDQKIISLSIELFLKYGIKSVSMDDISRHLGVSKKTIYEVVENKSELVKKAILLYLEEEKNGVETIINENSNPIVQMYELVKYNTRNLREMNPALVYDLQKYYPQAWQNHLTFKKEFLYKCVKSNLESGIEKGFYRNTLNAEIIAKIYLFKTESLIDQSIFPIGEFTFKELVIEYFDYHIHAICSEKGLNYLKENKLTIKN